MKGKNLTEEVMENGANRGYAYVVAVGEHPDNYMDGADFIEAACEECKELKSVDSNLGVEVQLIDRINHMTDEDDILEEVSEIAPGATVYRVPYEESCSGDSYFDISKISNLTDGEYYDEEEEEDEYMSEEEMDEWGY